MIDFSPMKHFAVFLVKFITKFIRNLIKTLFIYFLRWSYFNVKRNSREKMNKMVLKFSNKNMTRLKLTHKIV